MECMFERTNNTSQIGLPCLLFSDRPICVYRLEQGTEHPAIDPLVVEGESSSSSSSSRRRRFLG